MSGRSEGGLQAAGVELNICVGGSLSIVEDEVEEETVGRMKRKLEVVGTEADAAKVEVKKFREEILEKDVFMKGMRDRISLLEEQVSVLQADNERLRMTKHQIIGLPLT